MTASHRHTATLDRLLELVYLLDADLTRALARDGLTKARVPVLWTLLQDGPSTQKALADALGTTPRNVTGLVDGLEETGFVIRAPHPTDRRATLVTLTETASALMQRMAVQHDDLARQLFAGMEATTFAGFSTGLDSVVEVLHELVSVDERGDR